MSKGNVAAALVGILCLSVMPGMAQINGGRGPLHVRSAWSLDAGYFTVYTHNRIFGKVSNVSRNSSPLTYWNFQSSLSLNYGLSSGFELSLVPILYQDISSDEKQRNFLDDLYFFLKFGSLGAKGSKMNYGLELGARLPKTASRNIIFEPYTTNKLAFGATGIVSYVRDSLYPDDGFNLHFNLRYWNHNDVGERLTSLDAEIDTMQVTEMTQEWRYGTAMAIPLERFDLRLELFGNAFINKPPVTAFSRENATYLSPGIVYKPYRWMSLDCSVDLRVSADVDETAYGANSVAQVPGLPNYPAWRLNFGVKLTVLPRSLYSLSERDVLMKKAESRRELFEQIIKERRETDSAEAELEAIKEERRKAEQELARLQKLLEGDSKKEEEKKPAADSAGVQQERKP